MRHTAVRSHGVRSAAVLFLLMLAVLGSPPAGAGVCGWGNCPVDTEMEDDAQCTQYLCDQQYALCYAAACEAGEKPYELTCTCTLETGISIGGTSCAARAPKDGVVYSTYSIALGTTPIMTCRTSGDVVFAGCYDRPCTDNGDGTASCTCMRLEGDLFQTQGGGCDPSACSSTIWSGSGGEDILELAKIVSQCTGDPVPPACS